MPLHRAFKAILSLTMASLPLCQAALAADPSTSDAVTTQRAQALIAEVDAYATRGMKAFDVPGLAIGIVAGDKLVYAKGFGVRSKSSGQPVDAQTIFQVGSTTKAFLATSLAIMADRGKLNWDDRVADLYPAFQMKDPWVTREFRVFDLLAQRTGMPPLANDMLAMTGFDEAALLASLRHVEPVSSFRTRFAYTNVTHLLASRIVAQAAGAPDWSVVLQKELLDPLGMKASTTTFEAIESAPNHASGHRWTPSGTVEVPLTPIFPYNLAGAGNINSNIEDMARWLRLQLGRGTFEGRRIVSPENLAVTRMPKVALTDALSYAMGWYVFQTANGSIIWHDGDALSYSSFVGFAPDRNAGVIILTNETNVGFPSALGVWMLDQILGNPKVDNVMLKLPEETAQFVASANAFARPANPRPPPSLAPLTGTFVNASMGEATVEKDGDALILELATGAKFRLAPWDGDVFAAELVPAGRFGPIADLHYMTRGFAQFQMDGDGKLNVLQLTVADQPYAFRRK
ncbi:serine hydrolase [Aquabacter sp. CN5-332]|uniref:serine hydrolase n=1 Tax=Aquabacter sp. CN5-332 TaxID=3156608 RepID=UPI0032B4F3D1